MRRLPRPTRALHWLVLAAAILLGLLFGSFLNVCISRLPQHRSIARPRSHCPRCSHTIAWYDNLPLLSFALLRGRCRHCRARISWRYPLVELAVALAWAACVFVFADLSLLLQAALFCWLMIGLAVTDAETLLLPDWLTLPAILLGFAFNWLREPGARHLGIALAQIAIAGGFFWLVRALYALLRRGEGLGLGDIKLIMAITAFLGLAQALLTFFIGTLFASVLALALVFRRGRTALRAHLPYGTFLAAAALVCLFFGQRILHWYWSLF